MYLIRSSTRYLFLFCLFFVPNTKVPINVLIYRTGPFRILFHRKLLSELSLLSYWDPTLTRNFHSFTGTFPGHCRHTVPTLLRLSRPTEFTDSLPLSILDRSLPPKTPTRVHLECPVPLLTEKRLIPPFGTSQTLSPQCTGLNVNCPSETDGSTVVY